MLSKLVNQSRRVSFRKRGNASVDLKRINV